MADITNLENFLTDIATAIKTKKGTTEPIAAADFDVEISNLETGGNRYPVKAAFKDIDTYIEDTIGHSIVNDFNIAGVSRLSSAASTESPATIETIKGSIGIQTYGPNTFDMSNPSETNGSTWSVDGVIGTLVTNAAWQNVEWWYPVKAGKMYKFSYGERANTELFTYLNIYENEDTSSERLMAIVNSGNQMQYSFSVEEDGYLQIILLLRTPGTAIIPNIQLKQIRSLVFPLKSGQAFRQTSYLADDGVHSRANYLEFTGDETWTIYGERTHTFRTTLSQPSQNGICTHYENIPPADFETKPGVYLATTYACIISDPRFSTVDEFKTYLAEQKTNGTPVSIDYTMLNSGTLTPYEVVTAYTTAQQQAWEAMKVLTCFEGGTGFTTTNTVKPRLSGTCDIRATIEYDCYDDSLTLAKEILLGEEPVYRR